MASPVDEEDQMVTCCPPIVKNLTRPVEISDRDRSDANGDGAFWSWPFFGPLLFENQTSDCRDHCANERTFLSYLRLAMFMALVSAAIIMSFHLKLQATDLELRMARPLGIIFWVLSVACLAVGLGNYIKTVDKYSRRAALVQTGWKTQGILAVVVFVIVGTCVALLVINKLAENNNHRDL